MWFLYALLSAVFASVRRTNEKQLSHQLNHFTIGWTMQLAALPVLLLVMLTHGPLFNPFSLDWNFWLPTMLIWVGFYPLNTYLYLNAFKHGELSKILPLSSLGPIASLLLGWLLLGQVPSLPATIGILVIVVGIYVLNLKGRHLHNPLEIFTNDKANLYSLLGIVLVAIAGVLDKWAIDASSPMYYSFVSTLGTVVTLFLAARLTGVSEMSEVRQQSKTLLLVGTLFGLSYAAYIQAISIGPIAYVTAVRNSSALLVGSLMAFWILKESITKPKLWALVLILTGALLLSHG